MSAPALTPRPAPDRTGSVVVVGLVALAALGLITVLGDTMSSALQTTPTPPAAPAVEPPPRAEATNAPQGP